MSLESTILETQQVLQPLFSKPKLSTKLLSKPPFRFLHDIVTATIRSTNFLNNDSFDNDELDSKQIVDKASKVAFLSKLIAILNDYQAHRGGEFLKARPEKIVAGLEPINTNVLLVCLAHAATDATWNNAVDGAAADKRLSDAVDAPLQTVAEPSTTTLQEQIELCNTDLARTQQVLQSIIDKPKCTEKLLSKPPFRFLHDVILAVDNAKGLGFETILDAHEMDSSSLKDKTERTAFLDKVIELVKFRLSISSLDVRPKKIIAGLETDKTRHLLQLIALAASVEPEGKEEKEENEEVVDLKEQPNPHPPVSPREQIDEEQIVLGNQEEFSVDEMVRLCNTDPARTRQIMQDITLKPKCTDKLLSKPPFRFLHDLILAVNTALPRFGLEAALTVDELDSAKVKDKQSKMAFLDKVIAHVERRLDIRVDIRSKKVVSGLEADKTCRFLQLMAVAARVDLPIEDENASAVDESITGEENSPMNLTLASEFLAVSKATNGDKEGKPVTKIADENGEVTISGAGGTDLPDSNDSNIQAREGPSSSSAVEIGGGSSDIIINLTADQEEAKTSNAHCDDATNAVAMAEPNAMIAWPLRSRPGPPEDDNDEDITADECNQGNNPFARYCQNDETQIGDSRRASMDKGGDAGTTRNYPMSPTSAIDFIVSATAPLGQYMDRVAFDMDEICKEKMHWSGILAENKKSLEAIHRRHRENLQPLVDKVAALDEEIEEKENTIRTAEERIARLQP